MLLIHERTMFLIRTVLFVLLMPNTAFALSCSFIPNKFYYDLSTALILWPAIALITYDAFRLARPFLYRHQRRLVIWILTIPYLLFAVYILFAKIPKDLFNAYIIAVTAWPPFLIAAYATYRVSRPLYAAYPRTFVASVIISPFAIAGSYFIFKSEIPFLWTILVCAAIGFGAAKLHEMEIKHSPKRRLIIHFVIIVTVLALAHFSRPACCPAMRMREGGVFYFECGCICRDTPKPVELDSRERDLEEKANNGDDAAQYELGSFYFENSYTPEDDRKGLEWWLKAAAGGNKDAQKQLASGAYGYVQGSERKKWQDMSVTPSK